MKGAQRAQNHISLLHARAIDFRRFNGRITSSTSAAPIVPFRRTFVWHMAARPGTILLRRTAAVSPRHLPDCATGRRGADHLRYGRPPGAESSTGMGRKITISPDRRTGIPAVSPIDEGRRISKDFHGDPGRDGAHGPQRPHAGGRGRRSRHSEKCRRDVCDQSVEGEVNDGETETDARKPAPGLRPDFGRAFTIN